MKDHGDVSVPGLNIIHHPSIHFKKSGTCFFQAGNQAQQSCLATAGRADQNEKFLILDFQGKVMNSGETVGILFLNMFELNSGHGIP